MTRDEIRERRKQEDRRIRVTALEHVEQQPRRLASHVANCLGIHHGVVYREIRTMVRDGLLRAEGSTNRRHYRITVRGMQLRERLQGERSGQWMVRDAALLDSEPRTIRDAERKTWLLRIERENRSKGR